MFNVRPTSKYFVPGVNASASQYGPFRSCGVHSCSGISNVYPGPATENRETNPPPPGRKFPPYCIIIAQRKVYRENNQLSACTLDLIHPQSFACLLSTLWTRQNCLRARLWARPCCCSYFTSLSNWRTTWVKPKRQVCRILSCLYLRRSSLESS